MNLNQKLLNVLPVRMALLWGLWCSGLLAYFAIKAMFNGGVILLDFNYYHEGVLECVLLSFSTVMIGIIFMKNVNNCDYWNRKQFLRSFEK